MRTLWKELLDLFETSAGRPGAAFLVLRPIRPADLTDIDRRRVDRQTVRRANNSSSAPAGVSPKRPISLCDKAIVGDAHDDRGVGNGLDASLTLSARHTFRAEIRGPNLWGQVNGLKLASPFWAE